MLQVCRWTTYGVCVKAFRRQVPRLHLSVIITYKLVFWKVVLDEVKVRHVGDTYVGPSPLHELFPFEAFAHVVAISYMD